ncbi:MAG: TlpA family protein disulfide reductase [Pseudobacter sp.]|uniref:TlpA family protein disulfide reductase n=1 Tax=Pseudobacter sp. TaxID=2045420 RepID=UPI003F802AA3
MKPLIYIGSLLCCTAVYAQDVKLAGVLADRKNSKMELSNPDERRWTIDADGNGKFGQTLSGIPKGFYSFTGTGQLYLEPGFNLLISKKDEQPVYQGKGSKENNLIVLINANSRKQGEAMEKGDFNFVVLPDLIKKMEAWRKVQYQLITKQKLSPEFTALRKGDVDYAIRNLYREYSYNYGVDMQKRANFYGLMEKMAGNFDMAKMDSARKEMEVKKLTKEEKAAVDSLVRNGATMNEAALFKASYSYRKWLDSEIQTLVYTKYRNQFNSGMGNEAIKSLVVKSEITDPFLKDYLGFRMASTSLKMAKDMNDADSIYQAYSTENAAFKNIINDIYQKIKKFTKGAPAPEFVYTTVTGEKVSLSSLRGNLVYIDVWATWCGPCKAEIPHLKKVEEAYHGKSVKFVSISVDELKDAGKWKSYVIDNNLKGVQLMADNAFNSDFIKDFNIAAIPRFILIDKEGRIISANALRPSNKKLSEELDKYLAM